MKINEKFRPVKERSQRVCPITDQPLPDQAHGNRKYLDDPEVKKIAKDMQNEQRYSVIRQLDNLALKLDRILAKHYNHSQEQQAISKSILDLDDFAWDFNSAMNKIDGNKVYWILDYGYSITNKKIIIYYGNNPIRQL
jgi:hypothetical protein